MNEVPFGRFNWVDVIAVILFIRMGYVGFRMGLSAELVKLFGLLTGLFVSFRFYQGLGDLLAVQTHLTPEWAGALVMTSLALAVYFGLTRFCILLQKQVTVSFQPKLSKAGGLGLGLLRASLVTSMILVVCQQLPSPYMSDSIEKQSLTGGTISRVAPALYDATRPFIGRLWAGFRSPAS